MSTTAMNNTIDLTGPSPSPPPSNTPSDRNSPSYYPPPSPTHFPSLLNPSHRRRRRLLDQGDRSTGHSFAEVLRARRIERDARAISGTGPLQPEARLFDALPAPTAASRNRLPYPLVTATATATATGGGVSSRERSEDVVVDLAESESDDDEVVVTGEHRRTPPPPAIRTQPGRITRALPRRDGPPTDLVEPDQFQRRIAEIDLAMEQNRRAAAMLEDAGRRLELSPPPARPIRLGGAVFRTRDRQIDYRAPPEANGPPIRREQRLRGNQAEVEEEVAVPVPGWFRGGRGLMEQIARGVGLRMGRDGPPSGEFDPRGLYGHLLDDQVGAAMMEHFGAGPAGRYAAIDPDALVSKVKLPHYARPPSGFTANFELDDTALKPIELDEKGRVVKHKQTSKPYLACAKCPEPLLVSGAYRTPADRVWALRCGHMVDQRCLEALSTPSSDEDYKSIHNHPPGGLPLLDAEPPQRGGGGGGRAKRAKITKTTAKPPPAEFEWLCPVKTCCKGHRSIQGENGWVQKEGEGAIQVYA